MDWGTCRQIVVPSRVRRSLEQKKLVFLSQKVMQEVRNRQHSTSATIAARILEIYKEKKMKIEYKNVQRRVYDALNVLAALNIIVKDKNKLTWIGIFQDKKSADGDEKTEEKAVELDVSERLTDTTKCGKNSNTTFECSKEKGTVLQQIQMQRL